MQIATYRIIFFYNSDIRFIYFHAVGKLCLSIRISHCCLVETEMIIQRNFVQTTSVPYRLLTEFTVASAVAYLMPYICCSSFIKCKLSLISGLHIFSSCDPHFWLKFSLLSFRSLIRSLMERSLTLLYFWKMITMRRTCLKMGRVAQLWESLPSIKTINRSFSAWFICELFYYNFSIKLFYYSERNSRGSVIKCWKYVPSSLLVLSSRFKSLWNIFFLSKLTPSVDEILGGLSVLIR